MPKIFTKLNVGDPVATSGTRVFKKLTTEDPLPIWNGTDLTGTKWEIPIGWTADAGYGVFYVGGTAEFEDYIFSTGFSRLYIGYDTESTVSDGNDYPAENTILVRALGYHIRDNTKVMAFTFESGTDVTNTRLINWLLENGTLTSHTYVPVTAGLYDANDNLVASWDALVNTYGMDVEKDYTYETTKTDTASPYYVLTNNGELAMGTKIVIADGISNIGLGAFRDCNSLTIITIPDSVTSIGTCAFVDCTSLTSADIPDGVTTFGNQVFRGCANLTSVEIPDCVTTIGDLDYRGCTNLTSITIPNSVTSIGDWVFTDCERLTDVYYKGTEEQWATITIGLYNSYLRNATIHYNYEG